MTQPFNPLESQTPKPTLNIDLHDGCNEQTSIIVVHHERPEYLNMCVQSIHAMSHLNNFEVIVVDNASTQESQDYLDLLQQEGIKVVRNQKNEYWSKAANMGVAAADPHSKYFVFLHADTIILDPSWLDALIGCATGRKAGLVGTQLQSYWIQKQQVSFIHESCMLVSRECWQDIGPWPEELPLVGMAFIMTLRAQRKGHSPQAVNNNIVHHYRAFSMDPSAYERMCEQAMGMVGKLMHKEQI